jgi:flagellar motility protein MotE (MotC chaperone)
MIAAARNLRLVPLVVVAASSLLALKTIGLVVGGRYSLSSERPASAREMLDPAAAPDAGSAPAYTGSVAAKADEGKPGASKAPGGPGAKEAPPTPPHVATKLPQPGDAPVSIDPEHPMASAGERAVLESLNQRRQELDARARELDLRESLLKANEKKVEAKLAEVKEIEGRIDATAKKKDEAEAARFKSLVSMYENMKAKEAAKIFDRLELPVLLEVAAQINPRRMSDILAQMSPQVAERLTAEIAARSGVITRPPSTEDLPKIEGRPNRT